MTRLLQIKTASAGHAPNTSHAPHAQVRRVQAAYIPEGEERSPQQIAEVSQAQEFQE